MERRKEKTVDIGRQKNLNKKPSTFKVSNILNNINVLMTPVILSFSIITELTRKLREEEYLKNGLFYSFK